MSNVFVPSPPAQCAMPGTMNRRIESAAFAAPPCVFTTLCVVVDAVARRNQLIVPAVIHEQLPAALEERAQIRIGRIRSVPLSSRSASATSLSKSSVLKSQSGFLNTRNRK